MQLSNETIFQKILPFGTLNNYEVECLFMSDKQEITSRLDDTVLLSYLKNRNSLGLNTAPQAIDCQYYTEEELNRKTNNLSSNVSLFHINIRKLGLHRNELHAYLSLLHMKFDVIVLTEVGIGSEGFIENLFVGYSEFFELPKSNSYGGVAVFVKSNLNPTEIENVKMSNSCNCSNCSFENVWVGLEKNGEKSLVGGVYRHPGGDMSHFNKDLDVSLQLSNHLYDTALYAGDINCDIILQNNSSIKYVSTLAKYHMLPYITRPTRITNHSATLIDHIFVRVKETDRNILSGNLFCTITDHLPNFVIIPSKNNKDYETSRKYTRIFSQANAIKFATMNYDTDWTYHLNTYSTVNGMCKYLMYNIDRYFNECFPLVPISRQRAKDKPWITPSLRKSIQTKNQLYKDTINNPSPKAEEKYKKYKKVSEDLVNEAQLIYYEDIFKNKKNSVKLLWDEFGPILGSKKKKGNNRISHLVIKHKKLTQDIDIANAMNKHFCELGPKLAEEVKDKGKTFSYYLNNQAKDSFFIKPIDPSDVLEELLKLNHKKSAGPDGLTPKLVKQCAYGLYKPLTLIYNKSIETGEYPDQFKLAKVIPLYKEDKRCDPSNYRPISLLNCFDKIFEKLINSQLKAYLKKHNLLYEYQYSFREGYSTELALMALNDFIIKEIDKGNYVLALFIDLKKAFDTVNHFILCEKLEYYGIRGHSNVFFKNYLCNRKQYVACNGVKSDIYDIDCGVPQGSVLGPTLFLIYVNDMINCIKNSKLQLFADDTMTSISGKNLTEMFDLMKKDLNNLMTWFSANKLSLHLGKTGYTIFHSKKKSIPSGFDEIDIDGEIIKRKKSVKYLGLTFDEVLSWAKHTELLIKRLGMYYSYFYQLRKVIPYNFKKQLFHAYVYSKITYGVHCYGVANKKVMKLVQTVCNKLLKILLIKIRKYPTDKLFKESKMLKIHDMKNFIAAKFVHKSIYSDTNTPEQLKNYFTLNTEIHEKDVRDKLQVRPQRFNLVFGTTCIQCYGGEYWNKINLNIRSEPDLGLFKNKLKASILDSYS